MAEWLLYVSGNGRHVVEEEIAAARLRPSEAAQLQRLLERIATGSVLRSDTKWIREYGLWEARLSGDHRIFRLLFAKRRGGSILVAVLFTAKKSDRLLRSQFSAALARLNEWDRIAKLSP